MQYLNLTNDWGIVMANKSGTAKSTIRSTTTATATSTTTDKNASSTRRVEYVDKTGKPSFVFVHGAWHSKATWDHVTKELVSRGYATSKLDLPGAGADAKRPASFSKRPLDAAAFGSEMSPNADVTQQDRTQSVINAIDEVKGYGNGKVVLVGHSLGGLTISPVAEQRPKDLHAVVYLTAFLLKPGMNGGELIAHDSMAAGMVPSLFMADPAEVGAMRWDSKSPDAAYMKKAREAFYGDLTDAQFDAAVTTLHPDEPAAVAGEPSSVTKGKFGTVDRHYIRCTEDRAIPVKGQDWMIAEMDAAMGNKTTTHTMAASHSPFYSDVGGLCDILVKIAG